MWLRETSKVVAGLLLAAALLWWVFRGVDLDTLWWHLRAASWSGLAAAAAALGCDEESLLTVGSGPLRVYQAEDSSAWPQDWKRERREGGR